MLKTAKKRKSIVRSTCFNTIMSEKSTVSSYRQKSSKFRILGQFFRVGRQKFSFCIIHCDHTETLFTMDPLYSTGTSLIQPDVMTFCVIVRSRTCWLCFVAPIPRGLQSVAQLAPNFRQLRRTFECHI